MSFKRTSESARIRLIHSLASVRREADSLALEALPSSSATVRIDESESGDRAVAYGNANISSV